MVETREKLQTKKLLQQQLQLETQELSTLIESKNQLQQQLQIQIEIQELYRLLRQIDNSTTHIRS